MRVRRLTDDTVVTKVTEGDRLVAGFGTGHELGEACLLYTSSNPKSVEIFKRLGVNTAISAAYMIAAYIEQMSTVENLVNSLPLDQGNVVMNELMIGQTSPVAGKRLCEIELGEETIICCIIRGARIIVPRGQTSIPVSYTHLAGTRTV